MKKIILILILGILLLGIVQTKPLFKNHGIPFESKGKFCGIMNENKFISYSKNPDCFCPNGLEKEKIWIKPYCPPNKLCVLYFYPVYTCTLNIK